MRYRDVKVDAWVYKNITDVTLTSLIICDLQPGQRYMIELVAATSVGLSDKSIAINSTVIGQPPPPSVPSLVNVTDSSLTIEILPILLKTGPLVAYNVYIKDLGDSSAQGFGYLTAVFVESEVTTRIVLMIGDGKTYGTAVNRPLLKGKTNTFSIFCKLCSPSII